MEVQTEALFEIVNSPGIAQPTLLYFTYRLQYRQFGILRFVICSHFILFPQARQKKQNSSRCVGLERLFFIFIVVVSDDLLHYMIAIYA